MSKGKTINQSGDGKCKHTNIWLISGGGMCWCYECGAVRPNVAGSVKNRVYWQPPSYTKENPAMKKWYPALTWKERLPND